MTLQHSPPPKRKNESRAPGSLASAASNARDASRSACDSSGADASGNLSVSESVNLRDTQPMPTTGADSGAGESNDELKVQTTETKTGRDVKRLDSDVYKPWGARSRSNSDTASDGKDVTCKGGPGKMDCGELVKDEDAGVRCDVCMCWFHSECQAISKAAYSALRKFKILSWICAECKISLTKPKVTDHTSQITQLESKVDRIESMVKDNLQRMQTSVDKHVLAASSQARQIEQVLEAVELQKSSYAQAVKGTCNDVVKQVAAKIDAIPKPEPAQHKHTINTAQEISGVFDNFLDKEKRKTNLVVHNLEESTGDNNAEIIEQDVQKFVGIIRKEWSMNMRVTKAFRVGKRSPTKPRLLIVSMESLEAKVEVLKLARQLKQSAEFSNIYITPDLTWREREEGRRLREELARRRDSGEANLAIRRGKIVQLSSNATVSDSSGVHQGSDHSTAAGGPGSPSARTGESGPPVVQSTRAQGAIPRTAAADLPRPAPETNVTHHSSEQDFNSDRA